MRLRLICLTVALLCSAPSMVLADATVQVQLRTKDGKVVDGVVRLQKGERVYRCTTKQGRCELKGVAGGMYRVHVERSGHPSPKPRDAMIPPSGQVKLVVSAD